MKVYFYNEKDRNKFIEFIKENFFKVPFLVKEIDLINKTYKEKKDVPKINDKEVYKGYFKELNFPDFKFGTLQDYYDMIEIFFSKEQLPILQKMLKITEKSQFTYYPEQIKEYYTNYGRYTINGEPIKKKYPIFIPSKGRWDRCFTAQYLDSVGVEFRIIVEEQEYEKYLNYYKKEQLLILPKEYQENYDTLDDLGLSKSVGPGAARNFAWDVAIKEGYDWHWVIDDNVRWFAFFNDNEIILCDESGFALAEKFITSFDNVGMGSMNYYKFIMRKWKEPPFIKNTRMYSIILINNNIPFRWRGRYNEDTILSLNVLKSGLATIQTNFVTAEKVTTQSVKGGNSDVFYFNEGTLPKSYMLCKEFPDIAELKVKYGRWHHQVDYRRLFNNGFGNIISEPFYEKPHLEYNFNGKINSREELCKVFNGECHNYKQETRQRVEKEGKYKKHILKEPENVALISGSIIGNTYNDYLQVKDKFKLEEYDTLITCGKDGIETLIGFYAFENKKNIIEIEESEIDDYIQKYSADIVVIGDNFRGLKVDKHISLKSNSFLDF